MNHQTSQTNKKSHIFSVIISFVIIMLIGWILYRFGLYIVINNSNLSSQILEYGSGNVLYQDNPQMMGSNFVTLDGVMGFSLSQGYAISPAPLNQEFEQFGETIEHWVFTTSSDTQAEFEVMVIDISDPQTQGILNCSDALLCERLPLQNLDIYQIKLDLDYGFKMYVTSQMNRYYFLISGESTQVLVDQVIPTIIMKNL